LFLSYFNFIINIFITINSISKKNITCNMINRNIIKIIVTIIIIVALSISSVYLFKKMVESPCPTDQTYDGKLKRCINICAGKYPDGKGGCMDCKDKNQYKPPDEECQTDCRSKGANMKPCGLYCYKSGDEFCLPGDIICDTNKTTYDDVCCSQGLIYSVYPSEIWTDGVPWKDDTTISVMIDNIKAGINHNEKFKVTDDEYNNLQTKLANNKITTVGEFKTSKPAVWKSLKLLPIFKEILRPAFGLPTCGECPNELCPKDIGKCCGKDKTCTGDTCCPNKHLRTDGQCCKLWSDIDGCCTNDDQVLYNGRCYNKCKYNNTMCLASESQCYDAKTYNKDGTIETKSICSNNKCTLSGGFTEPDFTPSAVNPTNKKIHVCSLPGKEQNGPYASCKVKDISTYKKIGNATVQGDQCNKDDCYKLMAYEGLMEVDFNDTTQDKTCTSTINCSVAEGTSDECGKCPFGVGNQQCCWDDNKRTEYSGLLCRDNFNCQKGVCISNNLKCYTFDQALKSGQTWNIHLDEHNEWVGRCGTHEENATSFNIPGNSGYTMQELNVAMNKPQDLTPYSPITYYFANSTPFVIHLSMGNPFHNGNKCLVPYLDHPIKPGEKYYFRNIGSKLDDCEATYARLILSPNSSVRYVFNILTAGAKDTFDESPVQIEEYYEDHGTDGQLTKYIIKLRGHLLR
jgi:hypothetical protein